MLKTLARVDWDAVGPSLFVTLTYPDECIRETIAERTRDRSLFWKGIENYLGRKVAAFWRLEWKRRLSGSRKGEWCPHLHLIVLNVAFIACGDLRAIWRNVVAAENSLATDVQKISGAKSVAKYVSKYCAKLPESLSLDIVSYLNVKGRHWGILRRNLVPWHERHVFRVSELRHQRLLENAAAMVIPWFVRDSGEGFSLFGPIAEKVIAEICRTDLDALE